MILLRRATPALVVFVVLRAALACNDEPTCSVVLASDYDVSCMVDDDCVAVGQVVSCPAGECDDCLVAAVSKSAAASYESAMSDAMASVPAGESCSCPCDGGFAVCRAGKCEAARCFVEPSDTLPACTAAHGTCQYAQSGPCTKGPANSCAYGDEVCCVD